MALGLICLSGMGIFLVRTEAFWPTPCPVPRFLPIHVLSCHILYLFSCSILQAAQTHAPFVYISLLYSQTAPFPFSCLFFFFFFCIPSALFIPSCVCCVCRRFYLPIWHLCSCHHFIPVNDCRTWPRSQNIATNGQGSPRAAQLHTFFNVIWWKTSW